MQLAIPDVIYEALTEALGIEHVRVIVPDIGGGFGQKIHLIRKYAVLTALMAVKTGRPVKWIEDRSEHMMAGGHSCEQEFDVEAAVKADGEVLGLKIVDTDDVGGSISTLTIHFTNKLNNLFNTYKVQHLRLEGRSVLTNKCPVVPNRGIGKPGMCFVWERMMDRIAQELALDPIEVRRRNLIATDQFPYTTPNGNIHGSGDYQTLLDKVLANVGYEDFRAQAESRVGRRPRRRIAVRRTARDAPAARHRRRHRRRARRPQRRARHGDLPAVEADAGRRRRRRRDRQAREERRRHVHARLAELRPVARDDGGADRRRRAGHPAERIAMAGTFDSVAVAVGRLLVQQRQQLPSLRRRRRPRRGDRLRDKVLTLAAHLLKAEKSRCASGRHRRAAPRSRNRRRVPFAELGKIAYANQALLPRGMEGGLEATYYHSHPHADPLMLPDMQGRVRAQYTFSSAAHAAVVEVDPETGRVHVLRYVIVSDNGTLINPAVVDGQIYGSAAHGISVALGEGFVYGEDGQLLTLTLLDYGKSTTLETPHIEIEHYPVPDPFTTLGQKAAGEGAAIPSPAAIASAVEDALSPFGVKVRHLPLSPERVWQLINGVGGHF